ncbi:hypothetical protein S40288_09572 [Stachybotrys chartarum IBT 40288]|nr:hypothetical protein S40288_09572 [Stachybotrys chartarum IBT 40288]
MAYPSANLCATCRTLPFNNLPPFPDSSYSRTSSGKKYLHRLIQDQSQSGNYPVPNPLGVRHHPDLASLRAASAAGCNICREIERLADGLLADLADDEAFYAQHPRVVPMPGDPSFELWVTRRGGAGDGFWVSTKSISMREGQVFTVAGFGFYVEDVGWFKACDAHANCTNREAVLPTRVVDIGVPGPQTTVRLLEPDEGTKGRYTALSYCWGAASEPYVTSRVVLASRKAGFDVAEMPRTFQDAVAMTRMLGVRYIWIDSLCICQDDMQDWERESARMAAVYSNAYLTIAATGSSDTSGGLFFDRPARKYFRTEFDNSSGESGDTTKPIVLVSPLLTTKEALREHSLSMNDEPLSKRGWAFQERVLSQRVLHFASDQISLECHEGTVFEDGLRLPQRFDCAHQASGSDLKLSTVQNGDDNDEDDDAGSGSLINATERRRRRDEILAQWHALLRKYGTRELTFAADKFPALSGIAKAYADLLGDEYVAGIWRGSMIEDLCWQGLGTRRYEGDYRAPSWSWAAIDGMPATGFFYKHYDVATVVDYRVEIDGDNPYGRVKNAWIKLEAALVPLFLSKETGPTGYMCLETRSEKGEGRIGGFDTIDRNYSVSADAVRQMRLFALVLAGLVPEEKGGESGSDKAEQGTGIGLYVCLVVTPAGRDEGDGSSLGPVKRLGWINFDPDDFGPGMLDSRVIVTLV